MNARYLFSLVLLSLTLVGANFLRSESDASAPSVKGDRITFPAQSPQLASITVASAEKHGTGTRHVTGRLVWDEDATVRVYSPVAGRVSEIEAKLGDRVERGTALAQLDSPDVGQAQADARKANADLVLAERTLARTRDLFEHGAIARKDVEAAEDIFAGAQSEQQRAAARLTLFGASKAETVDGVFVLRAPLSGVVVERNLNLGQELRPDLMLANAPQLLAPQFVISDPRRLSIVLDLAESDLATVAAGTPMQVRSAAFPETVFAAHLDTIGGAFDPATRTVQARGTVQNPDQRLKAEMFVTVDFAAQESSGVDVPVGAVFVKGEKHLVYTEEKTAVYRRREVQVGAQHDDKIQVLQGLRADERVVIEGSLLLDEIFADANGS